MKLQFTIYNTICYNHKRWDIQSARAGRFSSYQKRVHVDSNFSTFTLQVYKCTIVQSEVCPTTRVQYRYRLDIKTGKYYKSVYMQSLHKYTLCIYRSQTRSRAGFSLMLDNQILLPSVHRRQPIEQVAMPTGLGPVSVVPAPPGSAATTSLSMRSSPKKNVINSVSQADAQATLKRSHFICIYVYIYIFFINSVKCQFEII